MAISVEMTTEEPPNTVPTHSGKPARLPDTCVTPTPSATAMPTMLTLRG